VRTTPSISVRRKKIATTLDSSCSTKTLATSRNMVGDSGRRWTEAPGVRVSGMAGS
jgi:hypothetical protein